MVPRSNISLEMQAFPKLEAIGEPLSTPVIWKVDSSLQVNLETLPYTRDSLTEQQPHVLLSQGVILAQIRAPGSQHVTKKDKGLPGLHPPFMRRRENISFSSADRVERNGAHVGLMALLLTLPFLNAKDRC